MVKLVLDRSIFIKLPRGERATIPAGEAWKVDCYGGVNICETGTGNKFAVKDSKNKIITPGAQLEGAAGASSYDAAFVAGLAFKLVEV